MARNMYGATSADFTLTSGGRVVPGAELTLWTARTGGTQITDLLDVDSVACTTVTSAADGSVVYYGPNNDKTVHWADSGQGSRVAIRPTDITGDPPVMAPWRFPGLHIVPPELCAARTVYAGDDIVAVRVFQSPDDIVVTGMQMASGAAAGVGVTLAQFALYHVGASASASHNGMSLTLLARSANDTTLFGSIDTTYTKSWSTTGGYPSAVRLRRDQWYAAGHVLAWDTTEPQLIGLGAPRLQVQQVPIMGFHPSGLGTFINAPWPFFSGSSANYGTGAGMLPWRRLVVDPDSSIAAAHTTVLLGDSFFASYAGWFAWGNAQSGSKLIPVMNAGVGGERLDQILARVSIHVAPYAPDAVVVHGGTNDVSAGASAATIQSRFTQIFDALNALGVDNIIACTVPSQTGFSAGQKTIVSTVNTWLKGLSHTNLTVADTQLALTTGDGVTSDAAKLVDAVHPNITGQQAMADVLDDVLAATF